VEGGAVVVVPAGLEPPSLCVHAVTMLSKIIAAADIEKIFFLFISFLLFNSFVARAYFVLISMLI